MEHKIVKIQQVSAPSCRHCKEFEEFWTSIQKDWPNAQYENVSILTPEGQELAARYMILASPGIIINGKLWATGGFDRKKFVEKLKELSE